ncbi:MAG: hypothetical protein ACOYOU_15600 [Kiritimatiellia bacterium]
MNSSLTPVISRLNRRLPAAVTLPRAPATENSPLHRCLMPVAAAGGAPAALAALASNASAVYR